MKIGYFTARPVRWIPEEVILRNGGHFAVSNSYFHRERAAEDYNYIIDENLYAEELGFDIVALNEHHGNPFCMGSVMNVEAAILARLTKKGRSTDTKRVRRILATCCLPSWPRLKIRRRSWARIFCSAAARTHSRASSIRCRR